MTRLAPDGRRPRRLKEIRLRAWRRILWRAGIGLSRLSLPTVARGIAFSGVMALLPGLAAFVSLYGLFADAAGARDHLSLLSGVLPRSALTLIGDEMVRIATEADISLSFTFLGGLAVAFWSANTGMQALFRGIDIAYGESEDRGSLRKILTAAALTVSAFAFLLVSAGALLVVPLLLRFLPGLQEWLPLSLFRYPLLFALAVLASEVLYRFGASRPLAGWRWISVGSTLTAMVWLGGSAILGWFVRGSGGFNATYGSLGAIFAMLLWSWLSALAILIGAKLNVEIEREIARDPRRQEGRQGS